jgi:hypothetical protein
MTRPANPPRHIRSIASLQAAINAYLPEHNASPKSVRRAAPQVEFAVFAAFAVFV